MGAGCARGRRARHGLTRREGRSERPRRPRQCGCEGEDNDQGNLDEEEIELPSKWAICSTCRGNGRHSLRFGAITESDRLDWDDEAWDDYMAGRYDARCDDCEGEGKVQVADRSRMTPQQIKAWEQQLDDEADDDAERRAEMRACYGIDPTGMDYRY